MTYQPKIDGVTKAYDLATVIKEDLSMSQRNQACTNDDILRCCPEMECDLDEYESDGDLTPPIRQTGEMLPRISSHDFKCYPPENVFAILKNASLIRHAIEKSIDDDVDNEIATDQYCSLPTLTCCENKLEKADAQGRSEHIGRWLMPFYERFHTLKLN